MGSIKPEKIKRKQSNISTVSLKRLHKQKSWANGIHRHFPEHYKTNQWYRFSILVGGSRAIKNFSSFCQPMFMELFLWSVLSICFSMLMFQSNMVLNFFLSNFPVSKVFVFVKIIFYVIRREAMKLIQWNCWQQSFLHRIHLALCS